jgi:hypothetical protein
VALAFYDTIRGDYRQMLGRRIKLVQSAVALTLLGCAFCPFVELLLHSNSSIFLTGHDTESSLAFLLLLIELSFAIAKLLAFVVGAPLRRLGIIARSNRVANVNSPFSEVLPVISPPVSLRI